MGILHLRLGRKGPSPVVFPHSASARKYELTENSEMKWLSLRLQKSPMRSILGER